MTNLGSTKLAQALAAVDTAACDAYGRQAAQLIDHVNRQMSERGDIVALLGPVPLKTLYANHAQHASVIEEQLRLKSASALIDLFVWVYKTHLLRGVTLHSFLIEFKLWNEAVNLHLEPAASAQIGLVYRCLEELHPQLVLLAHTPQVPPAIADELLDYFQRFLAALLKPDAAAAIQITAEYIKNPAQIPIWWESIIQPALYEIGHLWAQGQITVGQEHMATAITQRILAIYYPMILELPRNKGRIVVTASPGEHHEVGTRIVADLLELNGWDVYCTGASTPSASVIDLLKETASSFLCISTTLPSSLPAVTALIGAVRASAQQPRVIVGGQAYRADASLWQQIGADGFGATAQKGLELIEGVWP